MGMFNTNTHVLSQNGAGNLLDCPGRHPGKIKAYEEATVKCQTKHS